MGLKVILAYVVLIIVSGWTLRRPFIGVLANVFLFHMNPRQIGGGLEDIRFQFVLSSVLIISYLININQFKDEDENRIELPMKWLFAFLAWGFITCAWAAINKGYALSQTFDFMKIVIFSFLMLKIIRTEKEMKYLMYTILIGCWYTSFMARWGAEWDWIDKDLMGIATGGSGTHLIMFFPMLILFALYGNRYEKIAAYGMMPFILDFLPVTNEGMRSTFVGLVTAFTFFFIFTPNRIRKKSILPFAFGGILFVFVLTPPEYWANMATILNPSSEGSAASRSVINEASMKMIADYPFGVGKGHYAPLSVNYVPEEELAVTGVRDAHNTYLKIAVEQGPVGLFIWLAMAATTWWYFRRVRLKLSEDRPPTYLQLYALGLEIGMLGITAGIYTHNYQDLDTIYWFVAFSVLIFNLDRRYPNAELVGGDQYAEITENTEFKPVYNTTRPAIHTPHSHRL
ncbi:MAG: O-antigen ligase family protein [Deferribacteres bacterium]|nr:O-antigen ligase family protein [candidate division KSB1 bacterium]MCB9504121.1 O-antigen ligase family protein [Deferribacteres bacterium]